MDVITAYEERVWRATAQRALRVAVNNLGALWRQWGEAVSKVPLATRSLAFSLGTSREPPPWIHVM